MYQEFPKVGVEIICIGTEILLGEIINSNAQWISEKLALIGLPHYHQSVVGDNNSRLKNAIEIAASRSKIIITTGGLGPTADDITTKTISEYFNTTLIEKKEILNDIEKKITTKGNSNRKQALIPNGANIIWNTSGTAPGIIFQPTDELTIITLPGVPSELKEMWNSTVETWLKENNSTKGIIYSRILKFAGINESSLAEKVQDLLHNENPTIAPYANLGEVKLRITSRANNRKEAENLITPLEEELRIRTGTLCYGINNETIPSVVIDLLRKNSQTLAVAESCSGGGISASITSIPGASDVFLGGVVAYDNSIKKTLLDVPEELLCAHGAVSAEVVTAMAMGAKRRLKADWAIAISGIAGPSGGTPSKPTGLIYFSISGPNCSQTSSKIFGFHKGRAGIQRLSVVSGLNKLRLLLLAQS